MEKWGMSIKHKQIKSRQYTEQQQANRRLRLRLRTPTPTPTIPKDTYLCTKQQQPNSNFSLLKADTHCTQKSRSGYVMMEIILIFPPKKTGFEMSDLGLVE